MSDSTIPTAVPIRVASKPEDNINILAETFDRSCMDESIERTGSLFSQLDSMIAAVQVESSALDVMRERLKELDALKAQLSLLTKRLLEADQTNLTLKGNIMKLHDSFADLKRSKAELEASVPPLRLELNRCKDMYNKERSTRLAAQQEAALLRERVSQLEHSKEELEREHKSIPVINESNEILRNDLAQVRQRFKEDKQVMQRQINILEGKLTDTEKLRGEVRKIASQMLDLSNGGKLHELLSNSSHQRQLTDNFTNQFESQSTFAGQGHMSQNNDVDDVLDDFSIHTIHIRERDSVKPAEEDISISDAVLSQSIKKKSGKKKRDGAGTIRAIVEGARADLLQQQKRDK